MDRGQVEHEVKQNLFTQTLERLGAESRMKFSRDRFAHALAALDHPEAGLRTIVIAGTNGKGTVSLLVSAGLRAAGYRVQTYLSPHLQHPRERFLENGEPASLEELNALTATCAPVAEAYDLSYFEFLTLLAFQRARETQPDYLVLEVGMGGRLDATNVTEPVATAITNIAFDHQAYLGDTLDKILTEKMGILRPGVPVFTQLSEPLRPQLESHAEGQSIAVHYADDVQPQRLRLDWEGQEALLDGHVFRLTNPSHGTLLNAALAYQLLRHTADIPVPVLQRAFAGSHNAGRFETVQRQPRVVLSGDHNPAGIAVLTEVLETLGQKVYVVCGFSPDKPHAAMVESLRPWAKRLWLTSIADKRAELPAGYTTLADYIPDARTAVQKALEHCGPEDTLLVTGSLYLVGEVRGMWFKGTEEKLSP